MFMSDKVNVCDYAHFYEDGGKFLVMVKAKKKSKSEMWLTLTLLGVQQEPYHRASLTPIGGDFVVMEVFGAGSSAGWKIVPLKPK